MNERIKELEAQCWEDRKYNPAWFNSEKFAELIVGQCLNMADEFELEVNRSGLVDRIKEHFGVQE